MKKRKKTTIGFTISVAAIASAVTFILTSYFSLQAFNGKLENVNNLSKTYSDMKELDSYVRDNYYTDIDDSQLEDSILKGYVSGLGDKFSRYMTAEEYSEFENTEKGSTTGIGVTVSQADDGYIKIEEVAEGSPASEEDIKIGDEITNVDGVDVVKTGYKKSVESIRGNEGTSVRLTLLRNGKSVDVTVTRKTFDVKTVNYKMLDNNIGYIRISAFRDTTVEQFNNALSALTNGGVKSLVFDVRDNGGGLLDALSDILDPILPEGEIATATYKNGKTETLISSDKNHIDLPMTVLVNGNTASAAELFACSLRDFTGAKLVGENTYGKGVMQNTVKLSGGGAVTLTVATYQTTKSDNYNEIGLKPDEEVAANDDVNIDDVDTVADPQLKKAVSISLNEQTKR